MTLGAEVYGANQGGASQSRATQQTVCRRRMELTDGVVVDKGRTMPYGRGLGFPASDSEGLRG